MADWSTKPITRRRFIATASAAGAGLLAACSGPERSSFHTATPEQLASTSNLAEGQAPAVATVQKTPTLEISPYLSPTPATLEAVKEPPPTPPASPTPDPTATATLSPNQWPLATVEYVPVASRRLQTHWLSRANVDELWNGVIRDWSALGEPVSAPVVRFSYQAKAGPYDPLLAEVNIDSLERLEQFLNENPGGFGLLPRELVDFRCRTLRVDGINPTTAPVGGAVIALDEPRDPALPPTTYHDAPRPILMTWVGDIIFGRYVVKRMEALGDFAAPFRAIYPELVVADVTIGNLECSLSDSFPQPENEDPQTFLFKSWTDAVEGLKLGGIDILGRANNHSFNFGALGMQDTTDTLDAAGIKHFGMGHTIDEARKPTIIEWDGISYALLGYNGISDDWDAAGPDWAGTTPLVDWMVVEDIQRERANGHIVIPFFHWGVEYVADPTEEQRYFAHIAIDAGAALVMGSHPHWVQAVETYAGIPIVYSLGNFVFDQEWSRETKEGMFADVWMQGAKVLEIDLVPVLIEDEHRPRRLDPWEAVPVLQRVWDATDRILSG
jgi:poly-gamma-glutamate synthesis protein (capsule biosynthesis protein)